MVQNIESTYPDQFRHNDTQTLATHLVQHSSVVLVGMKRVGISNFLRFFLSNKALEETFFKKAQLLFIVVDAHDLVERAIGPFWTLLLKRMNDVIEQSQLSDDIKKQSRELFLESIQLKDTFYTYDCVQKLCAQISSEGLHPVLVLTRFDRLLPAFTKEFFSNLQGLKDAAGKLSYIFTSYRPLEQLNSEVFSASSMSVFAHTQYLKPALPEDAHIVLDTLLHRYHLEMTEKQQQALVSLSSGHVQYLHLSVLAYKDTTDQEHFSFSAHALSDNESITLQSEELFGELTPKEKEVCEKIAHDQKITKDDESELDYLKKTGIVDSKNQLFCSLLKEYILRSSLEKQPKQKELSRQEQVLFTLFLQHTGELVERNEIVEEVWPDQAETGVSDWAIDRLVARLRQKLKDRNEPYKITTVVTRGYKLEAIG